MPLVRIDLPESIVPERRTVIADVVYETLVDTLNVPVHDRFQVVTPHASGDLLIDSTYLGIERSDEAFIIDITLNAGRSVAAKQHFYAALVRRLSDRAQLRPQDVFVSLTEVVKENWSFGDGEAQYA
ncbi:tautomerase family protein [Mycobacterium sp. Aquia_213]|uniref:tautomerase family protein n=1 Tax=Mycobacterium sp. Aquia_213 TaxID=2991728 RepID=UPI00226EE35B|nr:tautomerase family protein [Mycobacterium sp. Aquia_213]WAC93114.1 tautomerase family protein [Mycobacterium sp. Aquia_213]